MNEIVMRPRARPWTTTEVQRAAAMWKEGASTSSIATSLGRGEQSVKHMIRRDRDRFPNRHEPVHDGRKVAIKMTVTPFLYRKLQTAAQSEGISGNMLIRRILRDRLVRGKRA